MEEKFSLYEIYTLYQQTLLYNVIFKNSIYYMYNMVKKDNNIQRKKYILN